MARWGGCSKREASGRGRRTLCVAAAILAALTLMMGLSVATVGCGGDLGAEAAVRDLLTAIEKKDGEAITEFYMDPEMMAMMEELVDLAGEDLSEAMSEDYSADYGFESIKFSDITLKSEQEGDEAVVTITGGTAEMTIGGETKTLTPDQFGMIDIDNPLYLHRVDGEWYVDSEAMMENALDDFDMEGMTE